MAYKKRGRRIKKDNFLKNIKNWFCKLSKPKKALLIIALLIVILAGLALAYAYSKFNKMTTDEVKDVDIVVNEEIDEVIGTGYTNFVLFGSDSRSDNVDQSLNTDTIIIVSLNNATKEIKMVSVYRDTLLDVKDGNIQKCNSAYARGGAAQAINMLNKNLDLNIKKYVTVSFSAVSDVVDMLGGIEVDVSSAEMKAMNKYIGETANIVDKKANYIKSAGVQTLDGVQATTYARIRKGVGDDFARTERQREVIQLVFEKALKSNLSTINSIIDTVLPQVSTNFTLSEILAYAADFLSYSFGETSGFPFEKRTGTIGRRGSCVYATDLKSNVSMLHDFLYETVDYQPSSAVNNISKEIDYLISTSKTSDKTPEYEDSESEEGTTVDTPETTPGDGTTPDNGTTTPDDGTTTPGDGTTTPGDGTTPPSTGDGSGTTTPPETGDGSGTTPPSTGDGSGTTTPPSTDDGSGTTTPPSTGDGGGTTTPPSTGDGGSTTPDQGTPDPGTGSGETPATE